MWAGSGVAIIIAIRVTVLIRAALDLCAPVLAPSLPGAACYADTFDHVELPFPARTASCSYSSILVACYRIYGFPDSRILRR